MKELIGLRFKRNKYGLSPNIQTVTETQIIWDLKIRQYLMEPVFMVKGENYWYNVDEVLFLNG